MLLLNVEMFNNFATIGGALRAYGPTDLRWHHVYCIKNVSSREGACMKSKDTNISTCDSRLNLNQIKVETHGWSGTLHMEGDFTLKVRE